MVERAVESMSHCCMCAVTWAPHSCFAQAPFDLYFRHRTTSRDAPPKVSVDVNAAFRHRRPAVRCSAISGKRRRLSTPMQYNLKLRRRSTRRRKWVNSVHAGPRPPDRRRRDDRTAGHRPAPVARRWHVGATIREYGGDG